MTYDSKTLEDAALLQCVNMMCAAARTAPKTKGVDRIVTMALTGKEKDDFAAELRKTGEQCNGASMIRDAGNIETAGALVLIGVKNTPSGLGATCRMCGFDDCAACTAAGARCIFGAIDLGIATDSAAQTAAAMHVDNRIMFSAGRAALALGLFGDDVSAALGIPLSISGKSPFFDRKK